MKLFLLLLALLPSWAQASFMFQYGLNYSSETEQSDTEYSKTRTFHKVLLAGSINNKKSLFLGWNINKWSSSIDKNESEDDYTALEMGPRLVWFTSESQNLYFSLEWNPYMKGERTKEETKRDIAGSSMGFGLGYRFKISRTVGLGAGIHYHSLGIKEEKIDSNEEEISDKITNVMPMLELTILTR